MADSTDAAGCGCAIYILVATGIADAVFTLIGAYPIAAAITVAALVLAIIAASRPAAPPPPPAPVFTVERAELRLEPPTPAIAFIDEPAAPIETARCLVCRLALENDVVTCRRCRTPHHRACFRFTRQCSVYACGSRTWSSEPRRWNPRRVRWDPAFRSGLRDMFLALVPEIRRHGGRCVHCGRVSRSFRLVDDGVSLPYFRCPARGCRRRSAPEIIVTPRLSQGLLEFAEGPISHSIA